MTSTTDSPARTASTIALSRATFDLTLAGRLRAMAAEFQVHASEQGDEGFPRWTGPNETAKSKSDRH